MKKNVLKSVFVILISVLVIFGIAQAGTITPPSGTPSAKFYTLTDIYNLITSNTAATEGDHSFTFSNSLAGTHYTLAQIYDALTGLITASDVRVGTTYLGVTGTFLGDLYSGSASEGVSDYELYTLAKGGVDDYNDGESAYPTGSYEGTWTDCDSDNSYCSTGDSNADAKDESTGLVWSVRIGDSGDYTQTWFWANNCYEPGTEQNPDGGEGGAACGSDGDDACQCVKKTSEKTGCEALGDGGWRLPYQKESIQAYVNGSSRSVVSYLSYTDDNYWSSTTASNNTSTAWGVGLNDGFVYPLIKTNTTSFYTRCVR